MLNHLQLGVIHLSLGTLTQLSNLQVPSTCLTYCNLLCSILSLTFVEVYWGHTGGEGSDRGWTGDGGGPRGTLGEALGHTQ